MRNVLCFGDSNTWGYVPGTGKRYDEEVRWPALTQLLLNNEFTLYEAGLSGRTINSDDASRDFRNGAKQLNLYLESCRPLDLVIIMLGTNDLKASLTLSIEDIKERAKALCLQVLNFDYAPYDKPEILLVAPAPFVDSVNIDDEFSQSIVRSKQLAPAYFQLAQDLKLLFLDAGRVIKSSMIDGIHWDEKEHRDFAIHLAAMLKERK
ncbi:MAG: SGNH/GDSL hydrolase family protein [Colwellia sp.]|nr:SGNH/GDSL hydrolase family protein [Colwellia sp.]